MKLYTLVPSAVLLALGLVAGALHTATVANGSLIKASGPAVYYVGADERRYVFPNDKVYFSWYPDFGQVTTVTDAELAGFTIGGNVTYRPGTRLVKIQSDPKVYAVASGGSLRWVKTEAAAIALFGSNWSKQVDDIPDAFFVNYAVGTDIASASDFNPAQATQAAASINVDKNLLANANANANANGNANVNSPITDNQPLPNVCTPACSLGNACVENACRAVPGPSALAVKAFIVDYADVCFVGDACTNGSCCTIAGNQFADNANLKAVRPADKYLYAASAVQLCGRATVSAADRNGIEGALNDFAAAAGNGTSNRVSVSVAQTRLSGQLTMSRVPGSCNWWLSPADLRDRLTGQIDNTADAVFVISGRSFDFGTVPTPDAQTVDQANGLNGAGYSYFVKEWNPDPSGAPNHSIYTTALTDQLKSSLDLGVSDPAKSLIGNHCRNGKKDLDETGVDCGGAGCNACIY